MFPNLFEATKEYWQQLDEIESRYKQGKLSIEEVDREVETLMKQLGRKRKETLLFLTETFSHWVSSNTELLVTLVLVLTVVYSWMLTMNN
ncbi:hypothetical protein [Crocosphaera chwakensis]|uniref:Uncharacterized protein n=1 Tax=Crocosphaera chwakensis CCY0110 TaxID=391612 RepID=A3IL70_9CHRO|nr:hypothetical protein [Crocosphaera chwakensis]EAZ92939.1 hypothetical protein CY0110_22622 [Crocosphaera chwakensis CCY0110]